jgi:hypothetical protein
MSAPFGMTVKDISNNLFPVVLTLALLVGITFVNIVPSSWRLFADSLPGRLMMVAVIVSTFQIAGWPSTVVATVLALLLLAGGPRTQAVENFTSMNAPKGLAEGFSTINEEKSVKKFMWYDEELLGREKKTRTEEVDTQAIN